LQVAGQQLELGGMAGDDPGPVFAPFQEGRDPVPQAAAQGIPQAGAQLIGGEPVGHFTEIDLQAVDRAYRAGGNIQPVEHAVDHGRQAVAAQPGPVAPGRLVHVHARPHAGFEAQFVDEMPAPHPAP